MITIRNRVKKIPINPRSLSKKAQILLDHLEYTDFDLALLLTTNKTIQQYNRMYRHKNKPTDILSFPFYPSLQAGETIIANNPEERNLGDIIISLEYVQKDAPNWQHTFDERMDHLLVHGICHLLGYDHQADAEYAQMLAKECELLRAIKSSVSLAP